MRDSLVTVWWQSFNTYFFDIQRVIVLGDSLLKLFREFGFFGNLGEGTYYKKPSKYTKNLSSELFLQKVSQYVQKLL